MPIVYQQDINPYTKIALWHIAEPEDFFLKAVTLQNDIHHPHKRLQHLAGRYLLKKLFPDFPIELILIADTKKPFIPGEPYHFSISHCGDYAAAIVSRRNRVGTDIELPKSKIVTISEKFLIANEFELAASLNADKEISYTLLWSIKESVFKWYGAGKVDFRQHINILSAELENDGVVSRCLFKKEQEIQLTVSSILIDNIYLTWLIS